MMSRSEILEKLGEIFKDVFDDEDATISEETTPEDIEDWDSLGYVYLTVEIEEEFGIKLGEPIKQVEKVAQIIDLIIARLEEQDAQHFYSV